MKRQLTRACRALAITALLNCAAQAAPLYSDNFEVDTSASYNVNSSGGNNAATFAYDYSAVGIPSAPNSGGTTKGLKLEANYLDANNATEIFSGLSVSPTGFSVTGDFRVKFDLWQNSIGPFTGVSGDGGSGSTQVTGYGWGTAGTTAQWNGGRDSVLFGVTGDGNSTSDWRVYPNSGTIPTTSPPYVATGSVQVNTNTYYATNFPGQAPPAAQTTLFASQTGAPQNGALAFKWHAVELKKVGNTLSWSIDGIPIANVDLTTVPALGGSNIALYQSDINATASTSPNVRSLVFGLVDNLVVEQIPEPASVVLCGLAGLGLIAMRRRLS